MESVANSVIVIILYRLIAGREDDTNYERRPESGFAQFVPNGEL